jgi:hypothetical protein
MGFRFRRSLKIAPGIRLNVSKSGTSWSIGKRGATVNIGKRGTYVDVGAPGTGLSYRQKISGPQRGARPGDLSRRSVWLAFGLLGLWIVYLFAHYWPKH